MRPAQAVGVFVAVFLLGIVASALLRRAGVPGFLTDGLFSGIVGAMIVILTLAVKRQPKP